MPNSEQDVPLKINTGTVFEGDRIQKRLKFLRRVLPVGIILQIIFLATGDLKAGVKQIVANEIITGMAFTGVLIASFSSKRRRLLFNITVLTVALSTTISFYDQSATRTIFLLPITVLVAYLLLSRMGGVIWTMVICSLTLASYFLDKTGTLKTHLNPDLMVFGIISTILSSILLYVYEGVNLTSEKLVSKRDEELSQLNRQLNQQLAFNKHTADELTLTLDVSQKNNKVLDDTKKAILNILEDSTELQAQLKIEKEGIEHTVQERTEQLRQEQARLRASINSLESGFLMTFKGDQEVVYNPALQKLFGLESLNIKPQGFVTSVYLKLIQDKLGNTFDLSAAIKKSQETAESFLVKSVEYGQKFISITGAPIIPEGQKQAIGCVVLIEDKTEAMLLERSKDEFISIASHELRTPLTAIRGNASMLVSMYSDQLPEGDIKSMIGDIKDASVRLIGIVNQFLSTSRLEQKRTVFVMAPVDISKTIDRSVKELEELANERKLILINDTPRDLPFVMADEARTGEVVVNVIGNAIKYTDSGTVKVTARTIEGFVEVDVEDTGIGIEAKNQALLFHKFQQATSSILTRDDSRSTGLGLYITKLLVEQMGGVIYLKRSEVGKGSIFTFTLPLASHK